MITRRKFFSLSGMMVALGFVGGWLKWKPFSPSQTYWMGDSSHYRVSYRRVFGPIWEFVGGKSRNMIPRHCVLIGRSKFMLQIGRFKEAVYFGSPTKYWVKPFQVKPLKCAP